MPKPAVSAKVLSHPLSRVRVMDNAEGSSKSISELSPRQQAVLVGTLLGDGCLARHGRFHRLHVKHKGAHRSLAEFKFEVFREFISMPLHEFDQRLNGRSFPCVQFASRTNAVFSEWYSRFYKGRRKIVPERIASYLDPLALTVWFMDDGAADHAGVTFQTHSFTSEEVDTLVLTLTETFGLAASSRRNKSGRIIYISSSSLNMLEQTIDPYLLEGFRYKLIPRRLRTP